MGYKDKGNVCIAAGDSAGAAKHYERGIKIVSTLGTDEQAKALLLSLRLNLALACTKEERYFDAASAATKVLEVDAANVKVGVVVVGGGGGREGETVKRLASEGERETERIFLDPKRCCCCCCCCECGSRIKTIRFDGTSAPSKCLDSIRTGRSRSIAKQNSRSRRGAGSQRVRMNISNNNNSGNPPRKMVCVCVSACEGL